MQTRRFPIFVEESRVPVWLSRLSPIEIGAISLGLFVFARGKLSEQTKRHEAIHYCQWRELGFIFFPLLYGLYYLRGYWRFRDGENAYLDNPFEGEAYACESQEGYLDRRLPFSWLNYR